MGQGNNPHLPVVPPALLPSISSLAISFCSSHTWLETNIPANATHGRVTFHHSARLVTGKPCLLHPSPQQDSSPDRGLGSSAPSTPQNPPVQPSIPPELGEGSLPRSPATFGRGKPVPHLPEWPQNAWATMVAVKPAAGSRARHETRAGLAWRTQALIWSPGAQRGTRLHKPRPGFTPPLSPPTPQRWGVGAPIREAFWEPVDQIPPAWNG